MDSTHEYGNNNFHVGLSGAVLWIENLDDDPIPARTNWWGTADSTVIANDKIWFDPGMGYNPVIFSPFLTDSLTTGVGKRAAYDEYPVNIFAAAQAFERNGEHDKAVSEYFEILRNSTQTETRKNAIRWMYPNVKRANSGIDEMRTILTAERSTSDMRYRAFVDYFLCDLLVIEGKYTEAADAFVNTASKYKGTIAETQMLSRASAIYSGYLNDKETGLKYADMVRNINPGLPSLSMTYGYAGVDYGPSQYERAKFKSYSELEDYEPEPEPETEEIENSISVSPNPANPTTTIRYSIAKDSQVKLEVYSILGQRVAVLVDGKLTAGHYSAVLDGYNMASGIYLYRFETEGFRKTGRLLLIK